MKKPKIRKEKLSIYLVKQALACEVSTFISVDNAKPPMALDVSGAEATLYVKKEPRKPPPPWTRLFTDHQSLPDDIFGDRRSVGAALVIKVNSRCLVLTFGTGFHLLKNEAIERDFGLRVTLNSVDPGKLRSLDKASYDHNPLNSRTQSSVDLGVFDLDVDYEMDMLYALTGASKVPIFGSHVTGRDALTLVVETTIGGLKDILVEAISRYEAELPKEFEWVDNIQRVKDKDILGVLDLELDEILEKKDFGSMWLGEPEVVDWEFQLGYSFDLYPKTPRHVVLRLEDLVQYFIDKKMTLNTDGLKNQTIIINNSEFNAVKRWSAYRCLYAEIVVGKERYILRNGLWYRVNESFLSAIDDYLKKLDPYDFTLPTYKHDREEEYNLHVSSYNNNIELMDKTFIKTGGPYDKLEFCDLIKDASEFIHVKYYRSSATLSHLFSQGFVAAESFVADAIFRKSLNEKLPASSKLTNVEVRPDPRNYRVVYAIATSKKLPEELPFFSKVTLKNALKVLKALDFKVSLSAIKVDPGIEVKKKYRPRRAG